MESQPHIREQPLPQYRQFLVPNIPEVSQPRVQEEGQKAIPGLAFLFPILGCSSVNTC